MVWTHAPAAVRQGWSSVVSNVDSAALPSEAGTDITSVQISRLWRLTSSVTGL
jgi:hypothetical protein